MGPDHRRDDQRARICRSPMLKGRQGSANAEDPDVEAMIFGNDEPMPELNSDQIRRALVLMHEWIAAPKASDGLTPFERQIQLDRDRARVIDELLRPFLQK